MAFENDDFMQRYDGGDLGPNWVPLTACDSFNRSDNVSLGWPMVASNEVLTLGQIRKRHFVFAKARKAAIAGVVRRLVFEGNQ